MNRKVITIPRFRVSLAILSLCSALAAQDCMLEVTVKNIRPGPGIVRMNICDHPDHFPDKPVLFYNFPKQEIRDSTISIDVPGLKAGDYAKTWNGLDQHGKQVATGVYFYKLVTNENIAVKKLIMVK